MQLRIIVPTLFALLALGGGCELGTSRILIVRNEGFAEAEVTYELTYSSYDDVEEETKTESFWETANVKPGQSLRRELRGLDSLYLEVRRMNGSILMSETYGPGDFKGPDDELVVVVRP